ncbi:MOSC domain-containing protein [Phaeobacter marinintestinus]|uniref:MOSC domain-containing protein n=1 Tax=Falsiphaeobacter marinintestinus TaxID=1492905 RepID=UPI0011B490E0|nr:MOSC domain-containing protein [Phaeobacter marinintestinus]
MQGTVQSLYHYPVKGLTPQRMPNVELAPGRGFPFDRVYAFARHDSGYDPDQFRPLPKNRFLVLMTDAALAGLSTWFDPKTGQLTVSQDARTILDADLQSPEGAAQACDFFASYLGLPEGEHPVLASGGDNRFTDVSVVSTAMMNAVSLINLETVRDFESRISQPVDPLRFRGNIYFEGWSAGSELDLVDREITIGDVRLRVCKRTRRCPATQVNPTTAERDIDVPALIDKEYGHFDMGIYAEVLTGGQIAPGSVISL